MDKNTIDKITSSVNNLYHSRILGNHGRFTITLEVYCKDAANDDSIRVGVLKAYRAGLLIDQSDGFVTSPDDQCCGWCNQTLEALVESAWGKVRDLIAALAFGD